MTTRRAQANRSDDWRGEAGAELGSDIVALDPLGGGDTAQAYRATLADGRTVFVKTHADPPPGFFVTEADGLRWLDAANAVRLPAVLGVGDRPAWLALAWIELGRGRVGGDTEGEAAFGRALAGLHASGAPAFGRQDARTTGSLGLPNDPLDDWASFYAERRLLVLARLARDRGALSTACVAALERVAARLGEYGAADEPPARLHGDLWAGNRVVDATGDSWLIDPAAHGGHRESDLAMMRLFGGFGDAAFAAYAERTPLAPGWRERVPLHQLVPLVVHAIKFGGHYADAVDAALAGLN